MIGPEYLFVTPRQSVFMKWALLSVWDKTGIVDLARFLTEQSFNIMSSGGTGKELAKAGIRFTEVSSYTGFPEMMDGRVKTLHLKVHGGLLGRRQIDDTVMAKHGINRIDLLVVNLYPFEKMAREQMILDDLIEYIDVGGPAMIRAAAKNYKDVAVVVDPADYSGITRSLQGNGLTVEDRLALAKKAFARTAAYDAAMDVWTALDSSCNVTMAAARAAAWTAAYYDVCDAAWAAAKTAARAAVVAGTATGAAAMAAAYDAQAAYLKEHTHPNFC